MIITLCRVAMAGGVCYVLGQWLFDLTSVLAVVAPR
jgi:hypothetical protein